MHHVARFCMSVERVRAGDPTSWVGVMCNSNSSRKTGPAALMLNLYPHAEAPREASLRSGLWPVESWATSER
jgi:hypothetical protein